MSTKKRRVRFVPIEPDVASSPYRLAFESNRDSVFPPDPVMEGIAQRAVGMSIRVIERFPNGLLVLPDRFLFRHERKLFARAVQKELQAA